MRIGYHRVPSLVLVVLCLVAALPGAAESATACQEQQPQPMTIAVTSPRPLADAIKTLERRHGVVITYEDAPNLSPDLIRDVTEEIRRSPKKPGETHRTFVPRGGSLALSYDMQPGASDEQVEVVLRRLVRQYNSQGYPGRFEVRRAGRILHVIPAERRSRGRVTETFEPILNTLVEAETPGASQSVLDAIQELLRGLSLATGQDVSLGSCPANLLAQTSVKRTSGARSAREQIGRILESVTERVVSWNLFFDPTEPQIWVLNVHLVR